MSNAVLDNTSWAVEIETTEGTYEAPTSGADFVQTLKEGAELNPAKELLQRDVFTGSIGRVQSRVGTKSVTGSMPVELRAGSGEHGTPEADKLYTSALGSKKTRDAVTTKTGNTAEVLQIEDADIDDFAVNDLLLILEDGNHQFSWVAEVDDTPGIATVTLGQPLEDAPADNVVIAACTQYSAADSGHPSLSITRYIETTMQDRAKGCRVTSMSVENFTTGQIASTNFGFEGLNYDATLEARPFTPNYDKALPPIILRSCVYQSGQKVQINDLTVSVENTLGFVTSTCSENGRISSRVTTREVTGTFNPYVDPESLTQFNNFDCNKPYSLFATTFNPPVSETCEFTGEVQDAVAIFMPSCISTEMGQSDSDGILQHDISFEANRGSGDVDEIKMAFFAVSSSGEGE